ncbi:MAG: DNRLRE domain-containing protein, partial [Elusimicrobiota bacterium]|nr:DNRLRE domain-containing protein [Elusimicrobiota bacterium]
NEGIEIHQAKLFIYPSVGGGNSNVYSLHPITVDWSENEVSWNERLKNIKWYNSGGAFDNKEKYFYSGSEKIRKNIFIFDITPLVKKWLKKKISNYGVILKEPDEDNIFRRTPLRICNKEERLHPRLILICESNINPELEGFLKYEEDWVDLYIQGMDGLLEKDLGKTIAYWTEASKKAGDEQIKSKINEHIKIIADFIQEQRAKTKN